MYDDMIILFLTLFIILSWLRGSLFITKLSKFMLARKFCSVLLIITKLLHLCVAFETWAAMLCAWSRIQAVD